ncbi:SPOR domain-containing protein [Pseudoxanthomonas sp. J35]|uniref:SPOR domain-containing protein n=1 Tax=Pseudoxanthomonas sp. J35 TaxID=935852 RepID=UPI00048FB8D7|nr:SPOR domain-containing protein [Pseudoxanthomonas sp. J35]
MAARRGRSQAKRNGGNGGRPAWVWLVVGLAIGAVVVLAVPGLLKKDGDGFARFGPKANPDAQPAPIADPDAIADTPALPEPAPVETAPQYDFYTVLPGNEVRMSDAELAASAREEEARRQQAEARRARDALEGRTPAPPVATPAPEAAAAATAPAAGATPATNTVAAAAAPAKADGARYILQAGAFGSSGDAEEVKARIAMIGLGARVETGQANGRTVYRVRMGPYATASELAEAKQKLADSGLPAMAIRAQ